MATPAAQLDQLIAMTFDKVKPKLADQITHKIALLAALDSKTSVTEDGGLTLRRPVMYALNTTPASYSGYDLIDTTPQAGFGYAEYQWRQFAGSITVSGEEVRKNAGSAQIIGLVAAKVDQLRASIEDELSVMIWADGTGNGGKDLLGIQAIVAASGTLGGIDPTTETWWKSTVDATACDLTTGTTGIKLLNHMYNTLMVNKSKPDFEFTNQACFEAYEALAIPNIRFQDLKMADFGFEVVAHKRAEVVFEPDVPNLGAQEGSWYFINSEHLEFVKHTAAWLKRLPFVQPYNQDAQVSLVISMGQLLTDCRRAHGVLTTVNAS